MGGDVAVLSWLVVRLLGCMRPRRVRPGRGGGAFRRAQYWKALSDVGADSLGIICAIAASIGVILSLQGAIQFSRLGVLSWVPGLVSVSLVKELGPLLTAIMITGRSGAAFAAEVGTMQISEEMDALEVMGLDPVRFIVWPKFVAMVLMVPCLSVFADLVGIVAGGVFSATFLGIPGDQWYDQTVLYVRRADIYAGLLKSLGFGACICIIGCWQGFLARQGAADVGHRTTKAVVQSIFTIIILDLFFTTLTYIYP